MKKRYFVVRTKTKRYLKGQIFNGYLFDSKSSRKCDRFTSESAAKKAVEELIKKNKKFMEGYSSPWITEYLHAKNNIKILKNVEIIDLRKEPLEFRFKGKKFKNKKTKSFTIMSMGYNSDLCHACNLFIPCGINYFNFEGHKFCINCIKEMVEPFITSPEAIRFSEEYKKMGFLHALVK